MEQANDFFQWVKTHRRQLIIAGISIATIGVALAVLKDKDSANALWRNLKKRIRKSPAKVSTDSCRAAKEITSEVLPVVEKTPPTKLLKCVSQQPFEVQRHIRKLPEGFHASAGKIASAAEYGIILGENETWVDAYMKGTVAA